MTEQTTLTVTILDREYRVACPVGQEDELHNAARTLNSKMREIRENGRVIGIERIAVMAALNLTHELLQSKPVDDQENAVIERLTEKLDAALTNDEQPDLDFSDEQDI